MLGLRITLLFPLRTFKHFENMDICRIFTFGLPLNLGILNLDIQVFSRSVFGTTMQHFPFALVNGIFYMRRILGPWPENISSCCDTLLKVLRPYKLMHGTHSPFGELNFGPLGWKCCRGCLYFKFIMH